MDKMRIIYTQTDEAPGLSSYSSLPIIKTFTQNVGINVEIRDISVSGRILAEFPEYLTAEQRKTPDLVELSKTLGASIIKLPNISPVIPQIISAVEELQAQAYRVPDYPTQPQTDAERNIQARYSKILDNALSVVPLIAGGYVYEFGPADTAPLQFQQFLQEGHLPWDSRGEFLALAVAVKDHSLKAGNRQGLVLSMALDQANRKVLEDNRLPSARVGQLDSRGSHFYYALYCAEALANQTESAE